MSSDCVSEACSVYSEKGYITLQQVFSKQALSTLGQSFRSVLNKPPCDTADQLSTLDDLILKREAEDHGRVYSAAQSLGSAASTYQLLGSSRIFERVSQATGFRMQDLHLMPLYLIVQPPSDDRFDYSWHQDGAYYDWCPDLITLWFPVNRGTNRDTGTISMIPGSHREGPRETDTFLKHGYFKQLQSRLKQGEVENEESLEIDLGDCCLMHGHAVHKSVANRGTTPRVAGVLRIANLEKLDSYERNRFYCEHRS
jgi:hypothetical protein